jgi:hypothetical protein
LGGRLDLSAFHILLFELHNWGLFLRLRDLGFELGSLAFLATFHNRSMNLLFFYLLDNHFLFFDGLRLFLSRCWLWRWNRWFEVKYFLSKLGEVLSILSV